MSETYVVRKTRKKDAWDISKFSDYKDADSMFTVSKRGNTYSCDCPGFWRQKDKSEHKHCKIVKFWKENLEETDGYAFWLEGDDIEYNHFMPTNSFVE